MKYHVATYDSMPGWGKGILAPSFKDSFLRFVGEQKEEHGPSFDKIYPLYEFGDWVE